jgi:seryl-tRNA synthetase
LNTKRNQLSDSIAGLIKNNKTDQVKDIRNEVQTLKQKVNQLEQQLQQVDAELDVVLHSIPNVPHASVQIGNDEKDNVEIRK